MSGCCEGTCEALAVLRARQGRVLKIVLGINVAMFFVEVIAGLLTRSSSVLADSLDMFGDAVVYASSLYVLGRGVRWQARMAALKGSLMALFGVSVLIDTLLKAISATPPVAQGMALIGVAALTTNLFCLYLLTRHREDDINMRSVWICSRNDIVANLGVLVAALGVSVLDSRWPDVLVGAAIALVFLSSAMGVVRDARAALRAQRQEMA